LAATARVVGERGYAGTNLDEIADLLDFGKASIYHYFDSKESLVYTMLTTCHEFVVGRLREIASGPGTADERLRALIHEMIQMSTSELRQVIRLFLHPVDWPESLARAVKTFREENDAIFRDVVEAGVEAGEFGVTNATVSRLCMQGALTFVPDWYKPTSSGDIDLIVDTVMRMFFEEESEVPRSLAAGS
jgi:AcrR family transcriptional regulator